MTADAIMIVEFIFSVLWRFFTSWYIPGTNVTPAAMAFFLMLSAFVLRTLAYVLARAGAFAPSSEGIENEVKSSFRSPGRPFKK